MKFKYLTLTAAIFGSLTLVACGAGDKKAGGESANVIKIATASPLSGGQATAGKDNESGARLAVEEINAAGGVDIGGKKYTVELVSEDDAGDPKQGGTVAQKIADDKSISAVVGHYNSGVTIVAQPIYAKANLVAFTVSTNPDVINKAAKSDSGMTMIYRLDGSDAMQGPALATFAQKKGLKNIAILDDATAYGKGLADEVEKKAKSIGLTVIAHESATDKTTDFKAILTKLKSMGIDSIFWGGYDDTAATLAKQARELGITATFLMPDAVCTDNYLKIAAAAAEGTICSATSLPLADLPKGGEFKANFEKRFPGQPMQAYGSLYYDGVYTAVAAIKKAGSTEPGKVAAAMKGLSLEGLTGPISFEDSGERKDAIIAISEAKGGKFVTVDQIK
ncbi:MAG: branched-chain amino acid ABC transporter substrate-binding protein [Formosimonas sp.]|jgi:branched-chain amino acid transport system substrate-binding protein